MYLIQGPVGVYNCRVKSNLGINSFEWVVECKTDLVCVIPEAFTLSIWDRTSFTGSIGGLHPMNTTGGFD